MRYLIALFLILVNPITAWPATCYGLKIPQKNNYQIGLEYNYLAKRQLEADLGQVSSRENFFLLSRGLSERFCLDLKVGLADIEYKSNNSYSQAYDYGFAGGYGCRFLLVKDQRVNFLIGFEHISIHPRGIVIEQQKHKAILDDWQISLSAGSDFSRVSPYCGVKISRTDYICWIKNEKKSRWMSDLTKTFGLVCGFNFFIDQNLWVNGEIQAIDQNAYAVSLNRQF